MKKPSSKMKKMKNSNLVVILPMIGIGVAYLLLLVLPNYRAMNKQRELLQLQQDFIHKTESLTGEISEIQAKVKRTEAFCDDWEAKAPVDAEIPQIHMRVNQCVASAGASVTGFDPQPSISANTLERVPLTLRATGTFPQLQALLAKLESMPETLWLENLRLKTAGKDPSQMDFEVRLVVFAKKSEKSD